MSFLSLNVSDCEKTVGERNQQARVDKIQRELAMTRIVWSLIDRMHTAFHTHRTRPMMTLDPVAWTDVYQRDLLRRMFTETGESFNESNSDFTIELHEGELLYWFLSWDGLTHEEQHLMRSQFMALATSGRTWYADDNYETDVEFW